MGRIVRALTLATVVVALCGAGCSSGTSDGTSFPDPDVGIGDPEDGATSCGVCAGCCQGPRCEPGTAPGACGVGGLACRLCNASFEQCRGGSCQPVDAGTPPEPTCGPDNCANGCCDGDSCEDPPLAPLCGSGGAACDSCSSTEQCKDGSCRPKSPQEYKVIVVSATVSNDDCGTLDNCDPYVKVKLGTIEGKTGSKNGTENPTWNEEVFTATEQALTSNLLEVEVWDDDSGLFFGDDQLGSCQLTVNATTLAAGTLAGDCGKASDVTFEFEPVGP